MAFQPLWAFPCHSMSIYYSPVVKYAKPNIPSLVKDFVSSKFSSSSLSLEDLSKTNIPKPPQRPDIKGLKDPSQNCNLLDKIFQILSHWHCWSSWKQVHTSPLGHFQSWLVKCPKETKCPLGYHASFPTQNKTMIQVFLKSLLVLPGKQATLVLKREKWFPFVFFLRKQLYLWALGSCWHTSIVFYFSSKYQFSTPQSLVKVCNLKVKMKLGKIYNLNFSWKLSHLKSNFDNFKIFTYTQSCYVAQTDLELMMVLPQPPEDS